MSLRDTLLALGAAPSHLNRTQLPIAVIDLQNVLVSEKTLKKVVSLQCNK